MERAQPPQIVVSKLEQPLARTAAKLQAGEPLTIAYLGGSLTSGSGARHVNEAAWRPLVTKWFQERFPKSEISEVNAAIGGTGSSFGVYRVASDVISKNPDLVFVEFAVNDSAAERQTKDSVSPAMEGIVRQIWTANPMADIVFVYTTMKSYEPHHLAGRLSAAAQYHQGVADHYGTIASVNVGQALWSHLQENGIEWNELLPDNVHPRDEGYLIYSKCMLQFLEGLDWNIVSREPVSLPAPLTGGRVVEHGAMIAAVSYANKEWVVTEQAVGGFSQSLYSNVPGAELEFEFTGNAIGLYVLTKENSADFEWSLDGGEFRTRPTWTKRGGQTGRPEIRMGLNPLWVVSDLPVMKHTAVIRLSEGGEGSGLHIGAVVINGTAK
jgi:lysophospholipase L1-like esterase